MGKLYLGEFEELVVTMVILLKDEAYGNTIVKAIKEHQNREVSLSAVHVTLYRLEEKGLVSSKVGGATAARGGRRKRYFQITNAGLALLREMKESRTELWKMIPQLQMNSI
ncbi:MAG: PadR family transcriptional regulator [Cytophagales bacterium]|nr:PadR family transcriptional regulator [Cytophagales bacterium]